MSIADLSNDISMVSKPAAPSHCIKTKDCSCGCEDDDVSRSYIENDQNTSKVTPSNAQHHHETEGMRRMRL